MASPYTQASQSPSERVPTAAPKPPKLHIGGRGGAPRSAGSIRRAPRRRGAGRVEPPSSFAAFPPQKALLPAVAITARLLIPLGLLASSGSGPPDPPWWSCARSPKAGPRRPQDAPKTAQDGPKNLGKPNGFGAFSFLSPFLTSSSSHSFIFAPKMAQDGPKTAQGGPKTAQDGPKTAQAAPR